MKKKLLSILISAGILGGTFIPSISHAAEAATTYKVIAGDSLWKISSNFNVSISDLKLWNSLTADTIYVGQTLKVAPIHIVQAGDTLWIISRKYGTTVDNLMKLNNLTSSVIKVGQVLRIEGMPISVPAPSVTPTPAPAPLPTPVPVPIQVVETVNYKVVSGDTLWALAQKYKTSVDAIMKTNMLVVDYVMPNQTLTIPVNSKEIVKPVGITMMKARVNNSYGDIYTWENAMRLWTVGTTGALKDLAAGKTFNVRYYGGSNHSDIVPMTQNDTNIMQSIYGDWSWANSHKRPMVLCFTKGGVNYQMAVSLTGMPHSTTDSTTNGMNGHCDLYFYNSTGHADPIIDPVHQANILKANGQ
ncbi:LysM peptidoglycan-binding domain-containing protein [Clostridium sp. YIM B02515]|uniref:LysM peptidoglycan-binding domain-containing protein n=1 Tax=Clostridium rhizosphaerae TaxID=2803861 RepID=A0ABS1TB21_9CLOT|nr:LysM peptidoglycan-binding domain-containing protein [Clostridium rhizosphaerae]MBL4936558.1 LysM peptidoglycan-binding domain-containing protein [Clostridium rhizosphaerae]